GHLLVAAGARVEVAAIAVAGDRLVVVAGAVGRDRLVIGLVDVAGDRLVVAALDVACGADLGRRRARAAARVGGRRGDVAARRAAATVGAADLEDVAPGCAPGSGPRGEERQRADPGQTPGGSHGTFSFFSGCDATVAPGSGPGRTTNPS